MTIITKLSGLAPIRNFITANGGEDNQNSGFMYHFETIDQLYECQNLLKINFPYIFHLSANSIQFIAQNYGVVVPAPIPIGYAWIITKVLIRTSEHSVINNFFEL